MKATKSKNLLLKLMISGTSPRQFIGFALANLVGAFILLFAFQAYVTTGRQAKQEEGVFAERYLIVSKTVTGATTVFKGKGGFDLDEISEIASMEGVKACHPFQAARFKVSGSAGAMGMSISTELFLESVPDYCLDVKDEDWKAAPDSPVVPIIIPRSFLDLYNFGFASSQDMPLVSESILKRLHFNLNMSGNGQSRTYKAKILGFTNRINTILVPQEFLEKANERFGTGGQDGTASRLMIEAEKDAGNTLIENLEAEGYSLDHHNAESFKLLGFIRGVLLCAALVGLLITVLAFWLMLVSIHLILEKNRQETMTLRKLGCPKSKIAGPYTKMTGIFDLVSWGLGLVLTIPAFNSAANFINASGISIGKPSYGACIIVATCFAAGFALLHRIIIRHYIK